MTQHKARDFESSAQAHSKAVASYEYLNILTIGARPKVLTGYC
jgi:hypothetical protein